MPTDVIVRVTLFNQINTSRTPFEQEYDLFANEVTLANLAELLLALCNRNGCKYFGTGESPYSFHMLRGICEDKDMQTLLENVDIKLGFPFLFRHSNVKDGNVKELCCDHVFCFTDLRIPNNLNPQDLLLALNRPINKSFQTITSI